MDGSRTDHLLPATTGIQDIPSIISMSQFTKTKLWSFQSKKKKKYLLRAKTPQNGRQQCAANKADTVSRFSIKISRQSNKYFIAHLPENFTDELPVKRFWILHIFLAVCYSNHECNALLPLSMSIIIMIINLSFSSSRRRVSCRIAVRHRSYSKGLVWIGLLHYMTTKPTFIKFR